MKMIAKYLVMPISIIFTFNVYSQELSAHDRERIVNRCNENNASGMERVRAFGDYSITSEQLLAQCIRSATEVALFNSMNTIENTDDLYANTVIRLNAKLNELRNVNNDESIRQYKCFNRQRLALSFAKNVGDSFLRRALITTNNLLHNNCVR